MKHKSIIPLVLTFIIITNISLVSPLHASYAVDTRYLPTEWWNIDKNMNYIDDILEGKTGLVTVYVIFKNQPQHIHEELINMLGGKILYRFKYVLNGYLVRIPAENIPRLAYSLRYIDADYDGYSDLLYIQAPRTYKPLAFWGTRLTDIRPLVWNLGYSGKGVRIALMDTGIYIGGRGFNSSRIEFHDLVNSYTYPYDEVGHGTKVAYILVGNMTPQPSLGEGSNEILTTYLDIIHVETDVYYYATGPFMVTGDTDYLKFFVLVTLYDLSAKGLSEFINSSYLVHYPSYTIDDYNSYDKYWPLNIDYKNLSNGYYLANITLQLTGNDPPKDKGLYYVFIRFNSNALGYLAYVSGVCYLPIMDTDDYPLHSGVAPNASLVVFKVGDTNGIYTNLVAQALDTIADWNTDNDPSNDVNIASMSFGGPNDEPSLHNAIKNALRYGVITVAAAGNNGPGLNYAGETYPAAYPEVITVAATNTLENITSYSSQGGPSDEDTDTVKPDVAAPGGSYYGPLSMKDSEQDGEVKFENGDEYEIVHGDAQEGMGTSFSTPFVSGLAAIIVEVLKEHGVWENDAFHAKLVKSIILASAHETYPLRRVKNHSYSPSLDRGLKDPHEGYGFIDGYAAVRLAEEVAQLLRSRSGLGSYPYDYGVNDHSVPFIEYSAVLRQGVLYGVSDINSVLDVPFGPSAAVLPVHFERYVWSIDGTEYPTRYGVRIIASTSDPANTDFDAQVYYYNSSANDLVFLGSTSGGYGVTDELIYVDPPENESNTDYIYYVAVKRATEDSVGGTARLYVGPGLSAKFVNGRYVWINATAASPNDTARYALILVYYRNATGNFVHRQVIAETSDLNGFANVQGYINILRGLEDGVLERLEDDYEWYVGVVFTSDKRSLANLTTTSVVEGPIVVRIDIGEPTVLDISSPGVVLDHTKFAITATLTLNDTGAPLEGKTIYFYRSTDLQYWSLIGSNTTNATGKAVLYVEEPGNGSVYYLAVYPGDNETQYTWTGYAVRTDVFLVTKVVLEVSDISPYTMEPVTITAKLLVDATDEPVEGEPVTIWLSYDGGSTWVEAYTSLTDENGSVTYTHVFLSSGSYLVKANFTGDPPHMILESESQTTTITSIKTPTDMEITMNTTDLRVFDTIGFTVRLNYTYDTFTKPIIGADIYLEQWDGSTWSIVDTESTDTSGYTLLTYTFLVNGTYTFRIHYPGNDTFTEYISDSIILGVKSLATSIELVSVPSSGVVGEILSATIRLLDERGRPIADEPVTLQKLVGGTWVDVDSETTNTLGEAVFSWSESAAGDYTYRVVYSGKDYVYNGSLSNTFTVIISTLTTGLVLSANTSSTTINKTVKLVAQLYSDGSPVVGETVYLQVYTGSGWTTIDSNTTNSNGYTVFLVSERYAGNYTFRAYYPGSGQYASSTSNELTIEFKPISTTITLSLPATTYTIDQCIITATLTTIDGEPLSGYQIYFWISSDGTTWELLGSNTTDSSGRAVYKHVFWISGTYYVKANFSDPGKDTGQWEYAESEATGQIIVEETTTVLVATYSATSAYINESITIKVSLRDTYGNPIPDADIQVLINGSLVQILKTSSDGTAELVLSYPYYYIIEVGFAYAGNETYAGDTTDPEILVWNPLPTTMTISVSNTTPVAGQTITITATITDTVYGNPVKGYIIYFWVSQDGANWVLIGTSTTDSAGTATISYTPSTSGTLYFKANFTDPAEGVMGSWVYSSSESSLVTVTVLKRPVTITVTSISPSEPVINETVTVTVQISSLGEPVTGLQLYLFNGTALLGTADIVDGTAVFEHVFTEAGLYELSIVFPGNDVYESSTKEFTITVKHKTTINLTVDYETLPNGSIKFVLKARLLIDGSPYPNKTIYFYKKGSWILIGTNTTDNTGTAILTYIDTSPSRTYVFSANYTSTEPIVASTSEAVTLSLPKEALMPPMPEPWITPLILLAAIAFILLVRRRR